jgi:hypothetical protein
MVTASAGMSAAFNTTLALGADGIACRLLQLAIVSPKTHTPPKINNPHKATTKLDRFFVFIVDTF